MNDDGSPLPWKTVNERTANGVSIKIVDANGGVVALLKNGGGRKIENAALIIRAVNSYEVKL